MTTVLIVDDHPVYRRGLAALLSASGLQIVGEAAASAEAIDMVTRLSPDVVLMDIGLPDGSGVATTEWIRAAHPDVRVVVVTMFDDDGSVRAALRAGACGYVVKDAAPSEIVAAVRAAEMGATLLGSGVTPPVDQPAVHSSPLAEFGLTPRERQLVDLLAKGLPNSVIAERMGLSAKTVANYLSMVLVKLGAADRAEAIIIIRRQRDGSLPPSGS
jgi:DNA-binding NarL/FixJ family response regulator